MLIPWTFRNSQSFADACQNHILLILFSMWYISFIRFKYFVVEGAWKTLLYDKLLNALISSIAWTNIWDGKYCLRTEIPKLIWGAFECDRIFLKSFYEKFSYRKRLQLLRFRGLGLTFASSRKHLMLLISKIVQNLTLFYF